MMRFLEITSSEAHTKELHKYFFGTLLVAMNERGEGGRKVFGTGNQRTESYSTQR